MSDLVLVFEEAARANDNDASRWSPSHAELEELCERARRAHPMVNLTDALFVRALAIQAKSPTTDEGLAELFLVAAAVAAEPAAVALFEKTFLDAAREAVRHMHLPSALTDDVVQKTAEKLLVADAGKRPKVLGYAGLGKLRGLVKVVAVRTALSELRKHGREAAMPEAGPDAFEAPEAEGGELAFVKERYRKEFKSAFEAAVENLSERERNLLRLHLLRGVTLAALADIYGVHRATVTRWLAAARAKLLKDTRRQLGSQLGLGRGDIESLMNWIGSRLDASVSRLLATRAEAEPELDAAAE